MNDLNSSQSNNYQITNHINSNAKTIKMHCVAMQMNGYGLLIMGPSGVGKSELALDLIQKGHKFIGDDVIEVSKQNNKIYASHAKELGFNLHQRQIGIINIKDLYKLQAVIEISQIHLVIEMIPCQNENQIEMTEGTHPILGLHIPSYRLPVRKGQNISTLIDVIVKNEDFKSRTHNSAIKHL